VIGLDEPETVIGVPPSDGATDTIYPVIGLPPSEEGAENETVTCLLPSVVETAVGAPGMVVCVAENIAVMEIESVRFVSSVGRA